MNTEIRVIEGKEVNVSTLFDTSIAYTPTQEEIDKVMSGVRKHINEFFPDYLSNEYGLEKMFGKYGLFWRNKGWLITAMKRSPFYNGNLQIVIPNAPYRRGIDYEVCENFFEFCYYSLRDECYYEDAKGRHLTREQALDRSYSLCHQETTACRLYHVFSAKGDCEAMNKASSVITRIHDEKQKLSIKKSMYDRERTVLSILRDYIRDEGYNAQFLDEETAAIINREMNDPRFTASGQKLTKLIGKIGKRTGLNKVSNIREISFTTQDGEYVSRMKDFGWNYQFAAIGDAINPIESKAVAVMSVNPVDYLRMSFGYKWASCMTTDKENRRGCENNYEGMYCGGTLSYMNDQATFLLYYLHPDQSKWNGKLEDGPEWIDKFKRCNFHLGEDKIVQGRVYPDGRDGGDRALSSDMRNLVQKIIADLYDEPNYWTVKKGTGAISDSVYSRGVHYRDYNHYEDCTLSYWKRIDGYLNTNKFTIGEYSICPECGEEHSNEGNIFCDDCVDGGYHCEGCGTRIDPDSVIWVDGETYCEDCATYCEDCDEAVTRDRATYLRREGRCVCDWCREDHYTWCDDVEEYVHNDNVVTTEEGTDHCVDSCGESYDECYECGGYHDMENLHYDDETDEYYCEECYEALLKSRREAEELEEYGIDFYETA